MISCSLGPNGPDWVLTTILDLAIRFAAANGRGGLGIPIFWAASNGSYEIVLDEVASTLTFSPSAAPTAMTCRTVLPWSEARVPGPGRQRLQHHVRFQIWHRYGLQLTAPLAAGVAALVIAENPSWTRDQIRQRLRDSCDKVGGVVYNAQGHYDEYGYGRLNAERAVR